MAGLVAAISSWRRAAAAASAAAEAAANSCSRASRWALASTASDWHRRISLTKAVLSERPISLIKGHEPAICTAPASTSSSGFLPLIFRARAASGHAS
eukprot:238106-Prymnesium_polylepis.2